MGLTKKKKSVKKITQKNIKKIECSIQMNNQYNTFQDKFSDEIKKKMISKNRSLEKEAIFDFKQATNLKGIRPQDDYYSYINDRWIHDLETDTTKHQKYIVQVDNFRLIQDKVYNELIEIIKEEIKKENQPKEIKILKNYYESQINLNTNKQSRKYANEQLLQIDELRKNKGNLWKLLALFNKNEIISSGCPFVLTVNPDDKEPTKFRCYIELPSLSLIDTNIYFNDETDVSYKKKYKKEFFKYLKNIFENAFGPNHKFNIKDVFDVELQILDAMGCDKIKQKVETYYNKVTEKEAINTYNFDFKEFAKELDFNYTPPFFITSNLNYLKCATEMLIKNWDSDVWRTFWIYLIIKQQQRWNKKGTQIAFEFLGKFVRGQESMPNSEIASIFSLGYAFNTFLSNKYIDKFKNIQEVEYVKTMAKDLKEVFIKIIKRNTWLQPKTKEKALKKLYNFNLVVGSPKVLREDPVLDYVNDDAWGNILKIANWRHEKAINLEGKPMIDVPLIDWTQYPAKFIGTQPYVVNASYTPAKNGIYIPLGYVQKPFVDLNERGIEYNLAHIGNTISHEMSHALDDFGSKYDENGVLDDWWTDKDKKKFKEIQDDIIKQYEAFAALDGIKFDAQPSIGENIADISGVTICREYLRDFQMKNHDILPIKKLSNEAFYVYYAHQARQKINKKALDAQLKSNPHPLDKYRVNVPLSRMPIFRIIYNIKKGDKMWWPSTDRIWESEI